MKKTLLAFAALAFAAPIALAQAEEATLAFPGAEGYARYVSGGRGGKVYHVTSLNDDQKEEGTLRWALARSGAKTIVFDVSGTIHLQSTLSIPANTTVAGQTAPGGGICVADYPVAIKGSNVIVRYMRFRLGNVNVTKDGADGWDAFGAMDCRDIMIDHCSVSWSIDECCSVLGNVNSTLQWCIVSQSLVNAGHTKGNHGYGGNWGGSGASFHHNLMIHHTSRTPRLGPRPTTQMDERMDMRNNVIYNFGGNGCYGGEAMKVNIVNNYYKPGPGSPTGTKGRRIAGIGIRTNQYVKDNPSFEPALHIWGKYFVDGNVNSLYPEVDGDNWKYGMYDQIDTSKSATDGTWSDKTKDTIKIDEPIAYVLTTTHSAADAYDRVLRYAGASLCRDSHDALMVSDAMEGRATYTGKGLSKGFINSQEDNRPTDAADDWSAWPTLESLEARVDTDGDGMPDEWEIANGYDPENPDDGNYIVAPGYTVLETYLNSLVEDITAGQNEGGVLLGDGRFATDVRDEYEISNLTRVGNTNEFDGGIVLRNTSGASYSKYGDYLAMSRDCRHTIVLPVGAEVVGIRIEGYGRLSGNSYGDASLVELNGVSFDKGVYTLPKGKEADKQDFTVTLDTPAKYALTLTWADNNPNVKIWLYTTSGAGITAIPVDTPTSADDTWYTTTGIRLTLPPTSPGLYIHNRQKVIIR